MAKKWYDFQEETCAHFKSIGFYAETNKRIKGVRTSHDIDVFVQTKFIGQQLTWLIETKLWKNRINKLQVLGLRQIVDDIGADKGFIISQKGFQKGALEAAQNSNITLLTFEELKKQTNEFAEDEILLQYEQRVNLLDLRYWAHSKPIRKLYGLRNEIYEFNYSVHWVLRTAIEGIEAAKKKEYPIRLNTYMTEQYGQPMAEKLSAIYQLDESKF